MVDLPKIPTRNELTRGAESMVSAQAIASVHSSWGSALESVAGGIEQAAAPLAEEAGRNAVVRDENGQLKVDALPIVGRLGQVARRSAELAFSVKAEGEIERSLLDLRNKTWQPVEQGGGGGDPTWFQRTADEFVRGFVRRQSGGYAAAAETIGQRTLAGHLRSLMIERERVDVKNASDVLKAREAELTSRLQTLAFDAGTNSDEFREAQADLAAIRRQRAADARFGYSPAEAAVDTERDVRTMRGLAIVGAARRDYQNTGDLGGAQARAEEALRAANIPLDERSRMLGQINSHLSGMAAVRQVKKQELRDRGTDVLTRMQLGETIDDREVGRLLSEMTAAGLHSEARKLGMVRVAEQARGLIAPGMSVQDRVKGLEAAGRIQGVPVAAGADTLGVARSYLGLRESDPSHAGVLNEFIRRSGGHAINVKNTAWCAGFVDGVLGAAGYERRGSLRAADFLSYGKATDAPSQGDVVVLKPTVAGTSGHVGFVVGVENGRVRYIAGNDSGKVQEATAPLAEVAGFRVPPRVGTPIAGVTDATAPADLQRRAAVATFGGSWAGAVATQEARKQFDLLATQDVERFEKVMGVPGAVANADDAKALLTALPHVSDVKLRERIGAVLTKHQAAVEAVSNPGAVRGAIAALQDDFAAGRGTAPDAEALKALQDGMAARDKAIAERPFQAAARENWGGSSAPNEIRLAAQPIDFRDPAMVAEQVKSRSLASMLMENKGLTGPVSLLLADDAKNLRAAAPGMDGNAIASLFINIASGRAENVAATLKSKEAREALVSLSQTDDPVKFNAAMSGLERLMRVNEREFVDAMDQDTLKRVLMWRDLAPYATDPKTIARMLNPTERGKEDEIAKAMRQKGEAAARKLDDSDLLAGFKSWVPFSGPEKFPEMETPGAAPMRLPQQALRADLSMWMGEFMAAGASEEKAKELAFTMAGKVWQKSALTGQVMKHAPERYYAEFGYSPSEMRAELQAELHKAAGITVSDGARALTPGATISEFSLVPNSRTAVDIARWQEWEKRGRDGPPPPPPRYEVVYRDPRTRQLAVVADENGTPRLFRWDVSARRARQAADFEADVQRRLATEADLSGSLNASPMVP